MLAPCAWWHVKLEIQDPLGTHLSAQAAALCIANVAMPMLMNDTLDTRTVVAVLSPSGFDLRLSWM